MLERTLDVLAAELGIDPVEIRRRNLLHSRDFPHAAPTGIEYDSGDYSALLDRLVAEADYDALRREQKAWRDQGVLLGVGVATVLDSTAWFSRTEGAQVVVRADGGVEVRTGSTASGQQHHVVYREIVRRLLPIAPEDIHVVEGDTDAWDQSDGSMGSRTAQLAGTAVLRATETVVDRLRRAAADQLEADAADIVFHEGAGFGVRGVPSSARSLRALVAACGEEPVEASCVYEQSGASYPSAAHLSVVEIDVDTGRVRPRRHIAVTDCGRVLDLPSAHGQVVGATVQGIAQALYEEAVFAQDGTPRSTSFAEYGIPSAAEVPPIEAHFLETPSPRNPLGAKGVGEIGMVAAPVAVQNAVVDALRHLGVRHLDMPCTPERVWAAINRATAAG
jgi:carbon-monoxide dehydrogenase large subunit